MLHHDCEEFDNDLGARAEENLPLATFLGIVYRLQSVTENVHTHHGWK